MRLIRLLLMRYGQYRMIPVSDCERGQRPCSLRFYLAELCWWWMQERTTPIQGFLGGFTRRLRASTS